MCQWHIFRPWEIPLTSGRIPEGCGRKSVRGKIQKMLDISIFPAIILYVEFRSTETQLTNMAA